MQQRVDGTRPATTVADGQRPAPTLADRPMGVVQTAAAMHPLLQQLSSQPQLQQSLFLNAIQQQQPVRGALFKPYETVDGEAEADCSSSWGFPSLPTLNTQFLRDSTNSISEYLPSVALPSISQHMPRMSIPSMSMPSFTMPNLSNLPNLPSLPTFISYRQHKSWSDLRESVRVAHRRLSEISNRVPFAFHFRDIQIDSGDAAIGRIPGVRLYFLCPSANTPETTLHYCDVFDIDEETADSTATTPSRRDLADNRAEDDSSDISRTTSSFRPRVFDWKPLINPTFKKSKDTDCEMNLEEKLLMERKRCMLSGITSYEFHQMGRRFVFASGSSLFYFDEVSRWGLQVLVFSSLHAVFLSQTRAVTLVTISLLPLFRRRSGAEQQHGLPAIYSCQNRLSRQCGKFIYKCFRLLCLFTLAFIPKSSLPQMSQTNVSPLSFTLFAFAFRPVT